MRSQMPQVQAPSVLMCSVDAEPLLALASVAHLLRRDTIGVGALTGGFMCRRPVVENSRRGIAYDVHIYTPDPAAPSVSDRLELCLYNQVCKKLANLVCNAQNIEQLREICGVTADGFTQQERMQNFARLER